MYINKGYVDTLMIGLNWTFHLQLMGHMGIIMDEKNPSVKDEKIIDSKCNCSIVAKMV